jgi:hypothetical protein
MLYNIDTRMATSLGESEMREKSVRASFPLSGRKLFFVAATSLMVPNDREMMERTADRMIEVELPLVQWYKTFCGCKL